MAEDKQTERAERSAPSRKTLPDRTISPTSRSPMPMLDATVQSPTTETGLPVEEQIHKEWDPKKDGGLADPVVRRGAQGIGRR